MLTDLSNVGTLFHYPEAGLALVGLGGIVAITLIVGWRAVPRRRGVTPRVVALCI